MINSFLNSLKIYLICLLSYLKLCFILILTYFSLFIFNNYFNKNSIYIYGLSLKEIFNKADEKQKLPRFASLKFQLSNGRLGPSKDAAIKHTYTKKDEPIKLLRKYNEWYEILDFEKNKVWLHNSQIQNKKFVIITPATSEKKKINKEEGMGPDAIFLKKSANNNSNNIAILHRFTRCEYISCGNKVINNNVTNIKNKISNKKISNKSYKWYQIRCPYSDNENASKNISGYVKSYHLWGVED
ncbi:MAG TPA: SH3 domain-containing protein [Candidatus Megaira endosymbiont of Hartmannula sinica]|nr:SH3 domain-containing protein [Candidatus Megaera endosymbiont of Hartmannula sinica]